jgi:CHRD domain
MLRAIGAAVVAALVIAGLAAGAAQKSEVYKFKAKLTAGAEVPKPTGVPAGATGSLAVTTVEPKTGKVKLTWKLTYSHLSGKAMQAHIHMGKKGRSGNVLVTLCVPCKSGQTGTASIARSVENALEAGKTYVNVHTAKNPAGEIRGQIRVTGGS